MGQSSRQVLALAELDKQKKDVAWADIYHSASRYNTGPSENLPVILPSSVMFSFARNRLLLGLLFYLFV